MIEVLSHYWPLLVTAFFVSALVSRLLAFYVVNTGKSAPTRTGGIMPLTGGIGIVCSHLAAHLVLLASFFWLHVDPKFFGRFIHSNIFGSIFSIFIAYLYFVLGLLDDIYHFRPGPKLVGFGIVLLIYAAFEVAIIRIYSPITASAYDYVMIPIVMAGTFFFANSYNFLDNADGHCGSASLGLFLTLIFLEAEGLEARFDSFAFSAGYFHYFVLLGALLGFLLWNFPLKAKLYLGDAGSLFLGACAFLCTLKSIYRFKYIDYHRTYPSTALEILLCVNFCLILLAFPLYDTCAVMLLRVLRGQNPTIGGQDHYSHRLMRGGFPLWLVNLIAFTAAGVLPVIVLKLPSQTVFFGPFVIWAFLLFLDVLAASLAKRAGNSSEAA